MPTPLFTGTPKENLRATRIFCIAMVTGVLLFALIALVLNQVIGPLVEGALVYRNIFLGITVLLCSFCILWAKKLYTRWIAVCREPGISLQDKLNQYRTALIIYMALNEGPALFAVIIFLLTGDLFLLAIIAIMLGLMLAKFPALNRAFRELELDSQEQQELV